MGNGITFFGNDSGAAAGPIAYVQDVFNDVSLAATNNLGLTSNSSTNPLGDLFGDNDSPRFGIKTLFVKDMVLEQDRSKWISNKPTYRIIWNENAPFASGYVAGTAQFLTDENGNKFIDMLDVGDIFGVTGTARRAVFLIQPSITSPSTIQIAVDNVSGGTYNVGATPATVLNDRRSYRAAAVLADSANETNDLHDFRISATTQGSIKVVGIQLYFENTGANIELPAGSTYVNKSKVTTTTGSSLAIPSVGSTLGGRSIIYKNSSSGYSSASQAAFQLSTVGVGSNAATSINVTTGTGASYPAGSVIAAFYGSTAYIGAVQSVSTDTLTVNPAIYPASGVSGPLYKLAYGGTNAVIGASLYDLAYSIGSTQFQGVTLGSYLDPQGNFLFQYGASAGIIGITQIYGLSANLINYHLKLSPVMPVITGASSFIRVDGYFSAAEIEVAGASLNGTGVYGGTFFINGIPSWSSLGTAITGVVKFPVFTDMGPGWNSFQWGFGSTNTSIALSKINLYTRKNPGGVSYGILATLDTLPAFVDQTNNVIGATFQAWGNYRRIYGSQLPIITAGSPAIDVTRAEGTFYPISASGEGFTLAFYGKNVALGGTFNSGTTVKIDGAGIASAAIWGRSYTALTEGFHSLQVSTAAGSTTLISCLDISRTYGELTNTQRTIVDAVPLPNINGLAPVIRKKNIVIVDTGIQFTTSSTGSVTVTGSATKIICNGNPVRITATGDPTASNGSFWGLNAGSNNRMMFVYIVRDGSTTVWCGQFTQTGADFQAIPINAVAYDYPGAGAHTYTMITSVSNGTDTAFIDHLRMIAEELD